MTSDKSSDIERRVLAAMDALDIEYEHLPIDESLADTAAFCAHFDVPLDRSANAIVVATKKKPKTYAVCLVLATTRLDVNRAVRQHLSTGRLSFASADEMAELTGMLVGGVTPFGLPADLPVLVDARVMEPEWVVIGTGGRSSKVKVAPSALQRLPSVEIVDGLARAHEKQ